MKEIMKQMKHVKVFLNIKRERKIKRWKINYRAIL